MARRGACSRQRVWLVGGGPGCVVIAAAGGYRESETEIVGDGGELQLMAPGCLVPAVVCGRSRSSPKAATLPEHVLAALGCGFGILRRIPCLNPICPLMIIISLFLSLFRIGERSCHKHAERHDIAALWGGDFLCW